MRHKELTGLLRYRIENGKVILQVAERGLDTYWTAGQVDSEWKLIWRDATIEDLTVHELNKEPDQQKGGE